MAFGSIIVGLGWLRTFPFQLGLEIADIRFLSLRIG